MSESTVISVEEGVQYVCQDCKIAMQGARLIDGELQCELLIDGELYPWSEALSDPESALDVEHAGEFNIDALDAYWRVLNKVTPAPSQLLDDPVDLEACVTAFAAITSAMLRQFTRQQWQSVHADLLGDA